MVQLSLIEEIKDKASRLIPTAYMEIVEECTVPHLLIPTYEHVKFLSDTVNKKPEAIVDVVRALRRRIADADVAVKHLTIQLLDSMIKNCTTAFHVEVASQKGLLRDLVAVACVQPTTGRAMQAKEAALLLTLNLSIWFRGHPAEECFILTTLADDVRNQMGPNCFEGLEPERNARMRMQPNPAASRQRHQSEQRAGAGRDDHATRSHGHSRERQSMVDAVAIDLPTSERVAAMLDACITFSEYLSNAEMNTDVPLDEDDVVQSYMSQVREDHSYVTILLSSNLQLDRDVLRTVADSQSAVLAKVDSATGPPHTRATVARAPTPPPAVPSTAVRSAEDTEQQQQQQHLSRTPPRDATAAAPPHTSPPRAEAPGAYARTPAFATGNSPAPVAAPPAAAVAPTVDDLFGDVQAVQEAAAAAPTSPERTAAPPPSEAAPSPASPPVEDHVLSTSARLDVEPAPTATRMQSREEAEGNDVREDAGEQTAADGAAADAAAAEPKTETEAAKEAETPAAADAPAAATATDAPPKDDDDFDAFLEGHMGN
ncbi:VHS domain containing protein [Novymonas esmeraldas]|uniref:VHS domain containing protein n=1 Tax=Novymonas esmeraldas TaxID=1808958 RepID=A0AAW0EL25_9TRYP